MKAIININTEYNDNLVISYKVFDRRGNRMLEHGCGKVEKMPEDLKEHCQFCEHYDGKYCLFGDEPIKIFHTGGECLWKGQR